MNNYYMLSKECADDFSIIDIDGEKYKFNPNLTQNIAILPNGDIINGDKLSSKEKQLLDLMRRRDSETDFTA